MQYCSSLFSPFSSSLSGQNPCLSSRLVMGQAPTGFSKIMKTKYFSKIFSIVLQVAYTDAYKWIRHIIILFIYIYSVSTVCALWQDGRSEDTAVGDHCKKCFCIQYPNETTYFAWSSDHLLYQMWKLQCFLAGNFVFIHLAWIFPTWCQIFIFPTLCQFFSSKPCFSSWEG